jgi:serine/threonine-protein kinase
MGAVYEGENIRIHRTVAIKVLHTGVAENEDSVQRFEREAQAAGRIGSEHIVEVLDLGNLPNGDRFMVMEYMDGDSLATRIEKRGRLTAREAFPLARQMLEGLAAAHGAGIIHRDLKPDNVFLLKTRGGQADFVKLLDFGISKFSSSSTTDAGFSMTRTGTVMGTPYYMSPEQAKGAKGMDHRADLYAAGVILYECITGQVPFNADTFNELLFKIVLETPAPLQAVVPDSDPEFNKIIERAMARDATARYQTAREFQQALDQWAMASGFTPMVTGIGAVRSLPAATPEVNRTAPLGTPSVHAATPEPRVLTPEPAPRTMSTGTPGSWANTGGAAEAAASKKSGVPYVALGAGALVLVAVVGFAATRGSHADGAPPQVVATEPVQPSIEEVRAAAAEDAKRVAAQAQKEADEKLRKAEEEARAAEERAKKAEAAGQKDEAVKTLEQVKTVRAAVTATKPARPAASPTAPASAPQQSGRKIRTEL